MKCNYCNYTVNEDTVYCPNCGENVHTKKKNKIKEEKEQKEERKKTPNSSTTITSGSYYIAWGILGYFIPIVGLILFIIWKDTKPKDSKAAGIGALIRLIIMIIAFIIMFALGVINSLR